MSEKWNSDSSIEEKKTAEITKQDYQLGVKFSIRDIDRIIKKYRDNIELDNSDYSTLCNFLDSKYSSKLGEYTKYLYELLGDKLKEEHFRISFGKYKDRISGYQYEKIMRYLFDNELDQKNVEYLRDTLYYAMVKIPELFTNNMISSSFQSKINQILPNEEILKRDNNATDLNADKNAIIGTNELYEKRLTNNDLKAEILADMPSNYSDLEKSIYIYIKLCQKLSYDPNYYANNNKYGEMHESFDGVSKIDSKNNNVVCYEFVTIYSELLKDFGINVAASTAFDYTSDDDGNLTRSNFADKHSNLKYTVDNTVVLADSTVSVLGGDLINAKMNNPLTGLQCLSVEPSKKMEFANALNKVYNALKHESTNFKKYDNTTKEKTLIERIRILFNDITDSNFQSVDFISYMTSIKHELFSDDELKWNLNISYLGKNYNNIQYPVVLFSINTNDILNVPEDTVQYLYDPNEKLILKMEKEEIESMFYNGELFFIDGKINIPNIKISKPNNKQGENNDNSIPNKTF